MGELSSIERDAVERAAAEPLLISAQASTWSSIRSAEACSTISRSVDDNSPMRGS